MNDTFTPYPARKRRIVLFLRLLAAFCGGACALKAIDCLDSPCSAGAAAAICALAIAGGICALAARKLARKQAEQRQERIDAFAAQLCEQIASAAPLSAPLAAPSPELQTLANRLNETISAMKKRENFDEFGLASTDFFTMQLNNIAPAVRGDFFVCALHIKNIASLLKLLPSSAHSELNSLLAERLKSFCTHLNAALIAKSSPGMYLLAFSSASPAEVIANSLHLGLSAALCQLKGGGLCYELNPVIATGLAPLGKDSAKAITNAQKAALVADDFLIYEKQLDELESMQEALYSELLQAICQNRINVYYQPKLSASGQIIGAEALARWRREGEEEFFNTADFIQIAESHGLIIRLERQIIERVCKDCEKLARAGQKLVVSINISPEHFERDELADFLRKKLAAHGLQTEWIELEITERNALSERARANIARLSAFGFAISLDDFGRDYNSISRLCALPVNALKIDKLFVDGLSRNYEIYNKILKGIINMAKDLGKSVIAEGVETAEQKEALKALGCDIFQGFYHYRAMDFDALLRVLSENKASE